MSNREKVIKGLECCKAIHIYLCSGCPYYDDDLDDSNCQESLCADALELLKEHGKEPERVMRIIRETIHQAMCESEKDKDFEDFVCELIEHRIYHTNR